MNGAEIGAALAAIIVAVLGLLLTRRDAKKSKEAEIETIPDNPDGVARARDRVHRIEAAQHVQPEGSLPGATGRPLD